MRWRISASRLRREVVGAEVVVGLAGAEHVPRCKEDRVGHRDGRLVRPAAHGDLPILGGKVGVFGAAGCLGRLDERSPKPATPPGGCRRAVVCRPTRDWPGPPQPRRRVGTRSGTVPCPRRSRR